MADRHAHLIAALEGAVLESDGALDRATRHAAAAGSELPTDLASLAEKVRDAPSTVTDADVAKPSRAGRSDDSIFELIIATALGAARYRLNAALRAMGRK